MSDVTRQELERVIADQFGVPRVVSVGRAALGLYAVLRCFKSGRNDLLVALSPAVCHDVVVAIRAAGAIPVFCDVDATTGLVPSDEWIRARVLGATVAIVVHLYGNPADMSQVENIFGGHECLVIDDAAQALGSQTTLGAAGGRGDVGMLSFGHTKQIDIGGGALLFRDCNFSDEVEKFLARIEPVSNATALTLQRDFRTALEQARADLRVRGRAAAASFAGLLERLEPSLRRAWPAGLEGKILRAIRDYPVAAAARSAKAATWNGGLQTAGFVPVGMGHNTVPWRFTCRLPGLDWAEQHRVAESMRARGVDVSNWYLPAHWMHSPDAVVMHGAEQLSREVFQFWVDARTPLESIRLQAAIVTSIIGEGVANARAVDRVAKNGE